MAIVPEVFGERLELPGVGHIDLPVGFTPPDDNDDDDDDDEESAEK